MTYSNNMATTGPYGGSTNHSWTIHNWYDVFWKQGNLPSGLYAVSLQTTGSLTTNVTAAGLAFSNGSNFSEVKGFAWRR
jgi:hypothetical protein